jgi:hypothetical protein
MAVPPKAVLCLSIGLAAKVVKMDNYFDRKALERRLRDLAILAIAATKK